MEGHCSGYGKPLGQSLWQCFAIHGCQCHLQPKQEILRFLSVGEIWKGGKIAAATLSEIPARKVLSAWISALEVEKELILRGVSSTTYRENGRLSVKVAVDKDGEDYLRLREFRLRMDPIPSTSSSPH